MPKSDNTDNDDAKEFYNPEDLDFISAGIDRVVLSEADDLRTRTSVRFKVHTRGIDEFYSLRKKWSWILSGLLIALVLFQCVLMICIGRNVLDFSKYKTVLEIQAVEYFGQIITLCLVVVNFLFNKGDSVKAEPQPEKSSPSSVPKEDEPDA